MTLRNNSLLLFVLSSVLFDTVDSSLDELHRILHPAWVLNSTRSYGSNVLGAEIVALVTSLDKHSPLHVQLLFDREKQGIVRDIIKKFSSDLSGLMTFQYDGSSTTLNLMMKSASGTTLLLGLCSVNHILDIFTTIKTRRLASHFVNWLFILEEEELKQDFMPALEDLVFEGTRVTLLVKEQSGSIRIYSVHITLDGVMKVHNKGRWDGRFQKQPSQLFQLMTSDQDHLYADMNGRQLTVMAMEAVPYFTFKTIYPNGTIVPDSGTDISIVRSLSAKLNFTFQVFRPPDLGWGYPQPDGTITGMIGVVARREAHLAVTGMSLNTKRDTVVDFTITYIEGILGLFSMAPKQKDKALAVLTPFTVQVWICILLSTLCMGPVLKVHAEASESFPKGDGTTNLSLKEYSFNVFRNLVVQSNLLYTHYWSQRFLFFSWYLFCLIVSALYSGTLTAALAVPSYEKPVDSLDDLPSAVNDRGYTITVMKDTTNEYIFKEATSGLYKQTWNLFNHEDRSKSFVSSTVIAMKLLEQQTIHICPKLVCKIYVAQYGKKRYHIGRENLFRQNVAIATPPGAPYIKHFNRVIWGIIEGGFIYKWEEDEFDKVSNNTSGSVEGSEIAITLTHLQAAFFVALLGILVATVVLLVESVVYHLSLDKP